MLLDPDAQRVRNLMHLGRPVRPDQQFVLATNSYRLAACGLFGPLALQAPLVLMQNLLITDVLRRYIARSKTVRIPSARSWRFAPLAGATALFRSSPDALAHLPAVTADGGLRIEPAGETADGFALMRLFL